MSEKYANKENLERFWSKAKEYIGNERKEIEDQLYNWQKTEKAPVVQCEPVPNSELYPIAEFKFKETLPEGEKVPENPSTITGISSFSVHKTGKNLCTLISTSTSNGVTCTSNNDGTYTLNGTATGGMAQFTLLWSGKKFPCKKGEFFTISGCPNGGSNNTYSTYVELRDKNLVWTRSAYDIGSSAVLEVTVDGYIVYSILIKQGTTVSNLVFKPQLEYGKVATEFEKPSYNEYIINLNDTYYGGSIDLSTGLMTVTWFEHTFDGTEVFFLASTDYETCSRMGTTLSDTAPAPATQVLNTSGVAVCTHYPHRFDWGDRVQVSLHSSGLIRFFTPLTIASTTAELQAFFAQQYANGTPVKLAYPIASPYTVQLTPQQIKSLSSLEGTSKRINTIYTDADSVQVEYQKYVGIDSTLDSNSVNAIQNKVVNSALNTKVSLSGDETIGGTKTFSNTINGNITGDASTVAGHIVSKDVPVNAAFTDTTYDPATQSTAGLMSASDKVKLDAVGSVFSFKGSVIDDTYLPVSDNVNGDAYLAEDTGHVHVYDGTNFVDIGVWAGIPSATDAQIDALFED